MSTENHSHIPAVDITAAAPLPGNGKFHVRLVEGLYQNLRRFISWPMILLFFGTVWLEINQQPAALFDFTNHRILLFGLDLSWYDLPALAGLLIAAASLLFFLAVGWGRVWCGFACPQSIWTWIFIRIEDFIEGSAAKRSKQAIKQLSGTLLLRRIIKHLLWFAFAVLTALTFTGYFVPIRELITDIATLELSAAALGWILIMALLTYFNAGLVREKVCLHMCPYSRFQGVMFDSRTYTVTYDASRGEPRAHLRGKSENSGDCVDCGMCVQVCPTGIDIRHGLQAACIDCGACIDACDFVMEKLQRPKGLIGFYSEQQLEKAQRPSQAQPLLRPRLVGYLTVLLITLVGVSYSLSNRTLLLVEIERDRGQLYQRVNGLVCNNYRIKLEAFVDHLQQVDVSVSSHDPAIQLRLKGSESMRFSDNTAVTSYRVCAESVDLPARSKIDFTFTQGDFQLSKTNTLIAPSNTEG